MRVLLVLLVFAIGFNGMSTVAHAFDSQKCHTSADDAAAHDCPESTAANGQAVEKNTGKDGHICLNCDHCCISHVAFPQFSVALFTPDPSETFELVDADVADSAVSGLKRPPKSLV